MKRRDANLPGRLACGCWARVKERIVPMGRAAPRRLGRTWPTAARGWSVARRTCCSISPPESRWTACLWLRVERYGRKRAACSKSVSNHTPATARHHLIGGGRRPPRRPELLGHSDIATPPDLHPRRPGPPEGDPPEVPPAGVEQAFHSRHGDHATAKARREPRRSFPAFSLRAAFASFAPSRSHSARRRES